MASLPPSAAADRKLSGCIPDEEIDATAVWYLMANGFAGDLRRLKEQIANRSDTERITLLAAKNTDGSPGLCLALQFGHADLVKSLRELLPLIPKEQRAELLAAKDAGGIPGVLEASDNGHDDTVEALFEGLLQLLPVEQRIEWIVADETPESSLALQNRHAAAVTVLDELLRWIEADQQYQLLLDLQRGLTMLAAQDGHTDIVEIFPIPHEIGAKN
jgi:uncharacterized protein